MADAGGDTAVPDASPHDAALPPDAPSVDAFVPNDAAVASNELAFVASFLGGISVYAIDGSSGALTLIGGAVDAGAHYYGLAVDPSAAHVYAIDLDAGDVVSYDIQSTGALVRMPGSPLHVGGSPTTLVMDPGGHSLYVGLSDAIVRLTVSATDGSLSMPADASTPAAGPAYLATSHGFLYASLGAGIAAFAIDGTGGLSELPLSPFAPTTIFGGSIAIDASHGMLLNVRFALNGLAVANDGALTALATPLSIPASSDPSATSVAFDPSGHFAYAVDTVHATLTALAVDASAHTVARIGSAEAVSSPYSVAVDATGRFVYVPGDGGSISMFGRDTTTGALIPMPGVSFPVSGLQPEMVIVQR